MRLGVRGYPRIMAGGALCLGGPTLFGMLHSRRASPALCSQASDIDFSFGVIADVQWADVPDGSNYAGTARRCYRGALQVLSTAVDWWSEETLSTPLTFVAQLGDLIDGQNAKLGSSAAAMEAVCPA